MLDGMQAGARGEHPAGEDTLGLLLQSDLVHLDEGGGLRILGRRPGEANARRHLEGAELHGLVDGDVEGDDLAGDLVEAAEHCRRILDPLGLRGASRDCERQGAGNDKPQEPHREFNPPRAASRGRDQGVD